MNRRKFFEMLFGATVAAPAMLLVKENPAVAPSVPPWCYLMPPLPAAYPLPAMGKTYRFRSRFASGRWQQAVSAGEAE